MTNEPPSGLGGLAHGGLAHDGLAPAGLAPAGLALDRAVDRYLRHVAIERGLSVTGILQSIKNWRLINSGIP